MSHPPYHVSGRFQSVIADDALRRSLGMSELNIGTVKTRSPNTIPTHGAALHSEHGSRYAARLEHELYHAELCQRHVARRAARLAVALQVVWLEEQASRIKAELDCMALRDCNTLTSSEKFYQVRLKQSLNALSDRYNHIKYDMDVESLREREEDQELWNEMQTKIGAWQQLGVIPQKQRQQQMDPESFQQHTSAKQQVEAPRFYCNNDAFNYGPGDDPDLDTHCPFYKLDGHLSTGHHQNRSTATAMQNGRLPEHQRNEAGISQVPILRPPCNPSTVKKPPQQNSYANAMSKSATYQMGTVPTARVHSNNHHFQVPAVAAHGPPMSSTTSGFFSTENGSVSAVENRLRMEMEKKAEQSKRHRNGDFHTQIRLQIMRLRENERNNSAGFPLLTRVRRSLSAATQRSTRGNFKGANTLLAIDGANEYSRFQNNPSCKVS